MNMKDTVWCIGVVLALGVTWGMTSQRISAMEQDVDRREEAIVMFTKMEVRLAVIEAEIKRTQKLYKQGKLTPALMDRISKQRAKDGRKKKKSKTKK